MVNTGEDVEQRPLTRSGEPDAIGGDHRHPECGREIHQASDIAFLIALQVALLGKNNIAGVIASSAGYPDSEPRRSLSFPIFSTAGTSAL